MMHACLGLSLVVAYPRAGWKRNYPVPTELPESIGEGRPCYWPICLQTSSWRTQETEYGHGLLHLILGNRPISWQYVLSKLLCHFFEFRSHQECRNSRVIRMCLTGSAIGDKGIQTNQIRFSYQDTTFVRLTSLKGPLFTIRRPGIIGGLIRINPTSCWYRLI